MRDPANDSLLCRSGRKRTFHSDLHLITSPGESNFSTVSPLVQLFLMENYPAIPITPELARSLMPLRPDDSFKGTFGKALVVAGSRKYTGAAGLAIQAALRSGAGLVVAAIPESIHAPLSAHISEAIWLLLPEKDGAITAVEKAGLVSEEKASDLSGKGRPFPYGWERCRPGGVRV